jgi:hypothetical protein
MTLVAPRGNTQFLRTRHPKRNCITMLKAIQNTKIDPIFAAIEAHRQATAARYPILEALGSTRDTERGSIEDAHDKAADIEVAATAKLRKTLPTTIAGVMAVTTYFVEHRDRYPCWIGGETKAKRGSFDYPEPQAFEGSLIRNLAVALAKISGAAFASAQA